MAVDPDFENTFEDYRDNLDRETSRLASYFRIFRRLHDRKDDRLKEMNIAPAFFQVTIDALFAGIVIWVHKLYDKDGDRGLWNFLTFVEYNRIALTIPELQRRRNYPNGHWMLDRDPISLDTISQHRQRIENLSGLQSIKLRRDKFQAHFDKDFFFSRERFSSEAPLRWDDINDAIELSWDIINTYSTSFDGKQYSGPPINVEDIDHLLDTLHAARNRDNS